MVANTLGCAEVSGPLDQDWDVVELSTLLETCVHCALFLASPVYGYVLEAIRAGALAYDPCSATYVARMPQHFLISAALEALDADDYEADVPHEVDISADATALQSGVPTRGWEVSGDAAIFVDDREDLPVSDIGDRLVEQMLRTAGLQPPNALSEGEVPDGYPTCRPLAWDRRYPEREYKLPSTYPLVRYGLGVTTPLPDDGISPLGRRPDDHICGTLQLLSGGEDDASLPNSGPTKWNLICLDDGTRAFRINGNHGEPDVYLGVDDDGRVGATTRLFVFRCSRKDEITVAERGHKHFGKALAVDYRIWASPGSDFAVGGLGRIRWPGQWFNGVLNRLDVGAREPD